MNSFSNQIRYVEYLLKNYKKIKNEIEQMKLELEYYNLESVEDTIKALSYPSPCSTGFGSESVITDKTSSVALVFRNVNDRINRQSKDVLNNYILTTEIELKKLEKAINFLDEDTRHIIEDLYISRLKWEQITLRRYISSNTINRHRKKGIREIALAFYNTQGVA